MIRDEISLPAPAKLNLFLHINGRRSDGYHELQTIFQLISLSDQLRFKIRTDGQIILHSDLNQTVFYEDNLVYKAAKCLQEKTNCPQGADIWLDKSIPHGAGLGGGSSDAATTLLGLNALWQTTCDLTQLSRWGVQLGADVPFFLLGQNAWAEGVGEILTPIDLPQRWFVLLIPDCSISTRLIFNHPELERHSAKISLQTYQAHRVETRNDCECVVLKEFPPVKAAWDWLASFGQPKLTGTGCCIFLECETRSEAETIKNAGEDSKFTIILAESINFSRVQQILAL